MYSRELLPQNAGPMDAKLTSVWFNLPPSFYRRVQRIAEEGNELPEDVLRRGVRLVLQERRRKLKNQQKTSAKAGAALVQIRWAKTSASDRRAMATALAAKRWGANSG
jgi:hypothetical protein